MAHPIRLERTPEFLIYGQGQQRRAIIEAIRLLDNGNNGKDGENMCKLGKESNDINSPQFSKDKAKKWLKFVTQVSFPFFLLLHYYDDYLFK